MKLPEYEYRTEPFDHQRKLLEETWWKEYYAIFWEQGTGKTKAVLDNVAVLQQEGLIDCLFVVAPNGVHHNWVAIEAGKHLPERLLANTKSFAYHSSKATTKRHLKEAQATITHEGFVVLAMSYDAFRTKKGAAIADQLLKERRCMFVLDESARIKCPKAKRTKALLKAAPRAPYRRTLTGTPVANGPFDIYTQMCFLRKRYWLVAGLNNFTLFKNYFATWEQGYASTTGRTFKKLVDYRNLKELSDIIARDSSRVLKEDVLDLPPKLYTKHYFDMSPKQSRLYQDLRNNFTATLGEGSVTADLAIVRMLRLQQVTCGYVSTQRIIPEEDDPDFYQIVNEVQDIEDGTNRRLALLVDLLQDTPHKAIIWARFTRDIDLIMEALGDQAVRYDGETDTDGRIAAIASFQEGEGSNAKYFVANAQAAGEGLTLTAARTVIYYNNNFKLTERLQSEDRAHRIGQEHPVQYIDIVANNTLDEHIIDALVNKQDIARQITGDNIKEWI